MTSDESAEERLELPCTVPDCNQIFHSTLAYKHHRFWHKTRDTGIWIRPCDIPEFEPKKTPEKVIEPPVEQPSSPPPKESREKKRKLTDTSPIVKVEKDDDCVILEPPRKHVRTSTPIGKPTSLVAKSMQSGILKTQNLPSPIVPLTPKVESTVERGRKINGNEQKTTNATILSHSSCKNEHSSSDASKCLDNSNSFSSSNISNKVVENSTLPLSVAIFARARQFPNEIMVIWCDSLDDDLLAAVGHNPAHSILCVQNLNAIQIPDSQRDMLKNSNIVNFNMVESNDIFTPWTVVSFSQNDHLGLRNKIFRNYVDVEKEFLAYGCMQQMTVTNVFRYSKNGLLTYLSRQLSAKILTFNCPNECFIQK